MLYAKNIWGLENLGKTDELPPTGYTLYNMVYKIGEGTGGPSRVFAMLGGVASGGTAVAPVTALIIACICFII